MTRTRFAANFKDAPELSELRKTSLRQWRGVCSRPPPLLKDLSYQITARLFVDWSDLAAALRCGTGKAQLAQRALSSPLLVARSSQTRWIMLIKSNYAPVLISIRIFASVFYFFSFAAFIMAFQWLCSFFVMQIRSRVVSGFVSEFRCRFHFQDQTRAKWKSRCARRERFSHFPAFVSGFRWHLWVCKSFVSIKWMLWTSSELVSLTLDCFMSFAIALRVLFGVIWLNFCSYFKSQ